MAVSIPLVETSRASQNHMELTALMSIVGEYNPKVIVEIGVDRGYSLEFWRKVYPEARIIGIQDNLNSLDIEATANVEILHGDSHNHNTYIELMRRLKGAPIDFLFIDGDHTYNGVKQDYKMYAPLVRHPGIIAMHDVALQGEKWVQAGVEVRRFWDELNKGVIINFEPGTGVGIINV